MSENRKGKAESFDANRNWYNLEPAEVIASLNSSPQGLSQEEAQRRLAQFGPNELVEREKISPWAIFVAQFKSFLVVLLLVAAILSFLFGDVFEAIAILLIVIFACVLGFVQEYRAERAMEALKRMTAPTALVLRDGKETKVAARELVPGDIILIKTGDRIPADARLIEAINLKTEEAPLTGESVPVEKITDPLKGEVNVGDRRNTVFMGTTVVYGRGKAIVTATGMATEFGKIAGMLQEVKAERTPLQVNLDRLGRTIGIACLVLCFVLAGLGIARGHEIWEMFIWGIALAVAAVPEALPAVVTISLAVGTQRMARRHALIRKLPAVETLGSATFICSDKTGTLTQGQMTVRRIHVEGKLIDVTGTGYEPRGEFYVNGKAIDPKQQPALEILLKAGCLCNDASLALVNGVWEVKGDPTEGALVVAASKAGFQQEELNSQFPRVGEIPFSSETKRMITVHQTPQGKIAYSKGAPEVVLSCCSYIYADGRERQLTEKDKDDILSVAQAMASDALRVLGIAYKRLPSSVDTETVEQDMVFVGLVGMIDSPREEVKEAIKLCDQAGIKSVMITGDHKLTATAVARELGLLKEGIVVSGAELDEMSDKEFEALVEKIEVYARVSPAHKLRIVEALIKKGHVVAMTGDGVNDAPALKRADIGVAMGITGTDVAKEAADMVLTDDNFASIVAAVEEGRNVVDNIRRYLAYLLGGNCGLVLMLATVILFGPLIGVPPEVLPLTALQILYINLLNDGLPAIALSVTPADPEVMRRKPRQRHESIFDARVLKFIAGAGIWVSSLALGVFLWALHAGRSSSEAMTLCFVTIIVARLLHALNCRSLEHSLFKVSPLTNRWLLGAIASSVLMLFLVLYVPFLQGIFETYALTLTDWAIVLFLASSIIIVFEIIKFVGSR